MNEENLGTGSIQFQKGWDPNYDLAAIWESEYIINITHK